VGKNKGGVTQGTPHINLNIVTISRTILYFHSDMEMIIALLEREIKSKL